MYNQHSIFSGLIRVFLSCSCELLVKLNRFFRYYKQWRHNLRTRYYLAEMSEHLLKDIEVTEAERQEEISKKFWQ